MRLFKLIIVAAFLINFISCRQVDVETGPVRIGISKAVPEKSYENYVRWIHSVDSTIICLDMYHLSYDSAIMVLNSCDGLLLTGGTDVYPGRFGKESDTARCWEPDFKRDTMEVNLIREAINREMPIMGICRGLQILNVYHGGTLYIDLPTDLDTIVKHQLPDTIIALHNVSIQPGSLLHTISNVTTGTVNSNHHQGIETLAYSLNGIAHSEDGLIESIELKNSGDYPFLLGVQWHPERMDYSNPLSGNIAIRFVEETKKYAKTNRDE
jgi:putative glutamine amidotransferase